MDLTPTLAAVVARANNEETCAHEDFPEIANHEEVMRLIAEVSFHLGTLGVEAGLIHPLAMTNEEAITTLHHALILAAAIGYAMASDGEADVKALDAFSLEDLGALASQWGEVGE